MDNLFQHAPVILFVGSLAICLVARIEVARRVRRRSSQIQKLAREAKMSYVAGDRFQLAERIGELSPIPAAADLVIGDVVYFTEADGYRYIFTAEYTVGVLRSQQRQRRVMMLVEPRDGNAADQSAPSVPTLTPGQDQGLVPQYRSLLQAARALPASSDQTENHSSAPAANRA